MLRKFPCCSQTVTEKNPKASMLIKHVVSFDLYKEWASIKGSLITIDCDLSNLFNVLPIIVDETLCMQRTITISGKLQIFGFYITTPSAFIEFNYWIVNKVHDLEGNIFQYC